MIEADPELKAAVHTLASHYPEGARTCPTPKGADYRSTCVGAAAASTGKPLWDSEAWGARGGGNDGGGATLARMLNWEPIVGQISATIVWQILWGSYDGIGWTNNALIRANSPWVGAWEVLPPGLAIQHTTHFASSGWNYLKAGSGVGFLDGGGTCVKKSLSVHVD